MDERGQFTFYRSFWEAINASPKKDKLPLLEAIIRYALDGDEPKALTPSQLAFFLLVKPTLDASRKKAANGKQGGSKKEANGKQTESKPKANGKQTESEKEREKEGEKENEKEREKEKENDSSKPKQDVIRCGNLFTSFWEIYPKKIDREAAWTAWKNLNPTKEQVQQILTSLDAWKKCEQWTKDGGQFIPNAAKFLDKGYWENIPAPSGRHNGIATSTNLGHEELENIQRLLCDGG